MIAPGPDPDPHHRRPFGMVRLPYPVPVSAPAREGAGGVPAASLLRAPEPWYGPERR